MSGNLATLQAIWAGLASAPTAKKLTAINAMMVAGPTIDIDVDTIANFLVNAGKMPALHAFVNQTPAAPNAAALLAANYLVAIINGADGTKLQAASRPGLLTILGGLSADARTGITAGNVTALNNVCAPNILWWQANGFSGPINIGDLIAAGNLF